MKRIPIFPVVLILGSLAASLAVADPASSGNAGFSGSLEIQASPWVAACQPDKACGIPKPLAGGAPSKLELAVQPTSGPGSAARTAGTIAFEASAGHRLELTLTVYSVEPFAQSGQPPYLQLKAESAGVASFTCAQSVRWQVPLDVPALICAARSADGSLQYGVTLFVTWKNP